MANTYTQLHVHTIFAVRTRVGLIKKEWKVPLYKYMSGIIQAHHHKLLAINGMEDHVHLFFGMRPTQSLSDLMQDVKGSSSKWINDQRVVGSRFEWQEGYGAFSYTKSQASNVIAYIENQEIHHQRISFLDEYRNALRKFDVQYDERYIFKPLEY